jgi:putative transposase
VVIWRRGRERSCDGPVDAADWPLALNRLWVADITCVPTAAGFLFPAVVLDAWSRRTVGGAMATNLRMRLMLDAPDMAVTTRKPADVMHHSDRGRRYMSAAFGLRCREAGIRPSTSPAGDADDNAMAEHN